MPIFEAMSGNTTTGSTVFTGFDKITPAILLWRSLLQMAGRYRDHHLAVAVLPHLNIGGMKLFQMELPIAPKKDSPRISAVARNIFGCLYWPGLFCVVSVTGSVT